MRLSISHTTTYHFDRPVAHALQRIRLMPKETQGQTIREWSMRFAGAMEELSYEDQNCNHVHLLSILPDALEVSITSEGIVETLDHAGVIGRHSGHLPLWSFVGQTPLTAPGARMRALAARVRGSAGDDLDMLHALSCEALDTVKYEAGHTGATTTAEEALGAGCGVCQDHAHIFIGVARLLGIPARYVSGYLMMDDRVQQEATHAWAEAHVKGLGWVGFDISNGISPDARYVRVATGRDYREAAPITGISFGGAEERLHVSLAVEQQPAQQ